MSIHWKAIEQYFIVVLFVFRFRQFVILEKLPILDLALSNVKGLKREERRLKRKDSKLAIDHLFNTNPVIPSFVVVRGNGLGISGDLSSLKFKKRYWSMPFQGSGVLLKKKQERFKFVNITGR